MSVRVITAVWDRSDSEGNERLVLLAIADHAHDDGGGAFPSYALLVHKTRLSERAIRDNIRKLEARGELLTTKRGRKNHYRILLPGLIPAGLAAVPDTGHRQDRVPIPADSRPNTGSPLPPNRQEPSLTAGVASQKTKTIEIDGQSVEFTWTGERWEEAG